jgi:hypothetical protein
MLKSNCVLLCLLVAVSGCVPTYTLVTPGANSIENLRVEANSGWNMAPNALTLAARKDSQTWTQDGLLLDRLVFIPSVPDGEPILQSNRSSAALPVFRADMLPNEIEELAESTFVKLFGEGNVAVSTENLRPQRFGEHRGVMFDMKASVTDSPDYRGMVGAFIANEELYMMYYLAAEPFYFGKHQSAAEAIIKSAALAE